jgi:predicted acyltransferase
MWVMTRLPRRPYLIPHHHRVKSYAIPWDRATDGLRAVIHGRGGPATLASSVSTVMFLYWQRSAAKIRPFTMSNVSVSPSVQPAKVPGPTVTSTRRLTSLDALRGFDMFWIVGGEELVHALYKGWPNGFTGLLHRQMDHQPWQGVHFYDLIFPLFVFMVGVSIVFSLTKTIEQVGKAAAIKRILVRSVVLYCFGLLVYGGISEGIEHVRWMGVLQRIALCYFFTSLLFCFLRPRGLAVACVSLLLGYWALTALVPVRDFNLEQEHLRSMNLAPDSPETHRAFLATTTRVRGKFDDGLNLPQQIDFQCLPGHKWDGAYDPEGILSTLPAIGTCLLGVFAGFLVRNQKVPDQKKVVYLLVAGIVAFVLGFTWGMEFPVIKKIWTSSYVLVAGGYASIFLAVFYQVIEIWQWRSWCIPFVWVGMNPITIYMAFHLLKFSDYAKLVVGGPVQGAFGVWSDMVMAIAVAIMSLGLARFLYQKKIFLRL